MTHTVDSSKTVAFSLNAVEDVLLDSAGAGSFNIGGQITVTASTADGNYQANVNIEANYL